MKAEWSLSYCLNGFLVQMYQKAIIGINTILIFKRKAALQCNSFLTPIMAVMSSKNCVGSEKFILS